MGYSDDFPDEETIKEQSYKEFKLDPITEKNLNEIEGNLKNKKITKENKEDLLEYLEKKYAVIQEVKREEQSYEGDANFNINRYLKKIKTLIDEIEKI
ncbi:MAG TPA: hypothetical protein VKE88_01260 [Candidatus Nanoarchaeia archaeon]|nr:hypothetical protein [Candidatus Nanoarchaeia archaeon]